MHTSRFLGIINPNNRDLFSGDGGFQEATFGSNDGISMVARERSQGTRCPNGASKWGGCGPDGDGLQLASRFSFRE